MTIRSHFSSVQLTVFLIFIKVLFPIYDDISGRKRRIMTTFRDEAPPYL